MSKISKEIVDKIEQRNALNEEITKWCKENLEMDGMDPDFADITEYHTGNEQGGDNCKEWCDQTCRGEDWYTGDYYWETEYEGKYLHMEFDVQKHGTGGQTMERLIDAGKILDNLSGMLKSMDDYDAVKKVINDMPTAYD